ncbi:MAG: 2-amino-4-hydroxy-6-hydroxymethyldihydropteridine diphosphokinase [candidate division Zixibacteria bacterium 4484_93]|nr:MAG: 2-amino-4-hydroxy-6-hydroxymethyldihydropteridine diphosphokinase [candidate division Zixibacteria bacterium 4484_93]
MSDVYLVLGSNIGEPMSQLRGAVSILSLIGDVKAVSSVYLSRPFGRRNQPNFYNQAVCLETDATPQALLDFVKFAEPLLGREPRGQWLSREIDMDIVLFDNLVIDTESLVIPHSGLYERDFFLKPITEIAPDMTEPLFGKRLSEMLSELENKGETYIIKRLPSLWMIA